MFENLSFVKAVGRDGIEELLVKGYTLKQIADIYDVSMPTLYKALRLLYGRKWKKELSVILTAKCMTSCIKVCRMPVTI